MVQVFPDKSRGSNCTFSPPHPKTKYNRVSKVHIGLICFLYHILERNTYKYILKYVDVPLIFEALTEVSVVL